MSTDNCPISTDGLRMLVALLEGLEPASMDAARKVEAERRLVNERLVAAFGEVVDSRDVILALGVMS